jgi:hypothetical protein
MKENMNYTCRALLTKNILKESKIWVAKGSIFNILSTNNSTKIRQNSKSLLDMSIEARKSRKVTINGSRKILFDCPFNEHFLKAYDQTDLRQRFTSIQVLLLIGASIQIYTEKHHLMLKWAFYNFSEVVYSLF